jgi:alpha-galactosidase
MRSGAWRLQIQHVADGLSLSFKLPTMSTSLVRGTVEGPHVIVGAAEGRLPEASAALRRYVVDGLRGGRGFAPLVTFNSWFADGTRVNDPSVRDSMARAAALGTELFVLDAGWYAGAGAEGLFDFDSGLGRWQPDPARFPEGLDALARHAHELGMKFGIWVEPERIDLDVLSEVGVDSTWLATSEGRHVTDRTGQICLAGAAGRQWVWERLTSFIDQVRPDYLKWDNNAWLNCDREGHGHGPSEGNFAHVSALYEILGQLRDRYPDLIIENVSGGGNRLDFGMLRYSDVGWMDDRSGPSRYVRHHAEGLGAVFPPAYLLAFVTTQDSAEGLTSFQDIALYFRSRMMGVLGMSFSLQGLVTGDAILRETDTYKRLRATLQDGSGAVLSAQAQMADGPSWDAFQVTGSDGNQALLYAFQNETDVHPLMLQGTALRPEAMYRVESVDAGDLGEARGSELMSEGIEIFPSERTAGHILLLRQTSP